jgi:nitroreductase
MNQQPWTFTVVRDPVLLDRISREAKQQLLAATPAGPQAEHMQTLLGDADFHLFYCPKSVVRPVPAPPAVRPRLLETAQT